MTRWEYAGLLWLGPGVGKTRRLEFSHRENVDKLPGGTGSLYSMLRNLGDDGWEIISMHIIPKDEGGGSMTWFKQPVAE